MKRVKIKRIRPNPLFEIWLEEWMNEAAARGSDLQHHFSNALKSLKKYPLPLDSGKDCIILQHFGLKLCSMLDKKLEQEKIKEKEKVECSKLIDVNEKSVCIHKSKETHVLTTENSSESCENGSKSKKTQKEKKQNSVTQVANKNTTQVANKNMTQVLVRSQTISSNQAEEKTYLFPESFDIILLVDTQETCGKKTNPQHDATIAELTRSAVQFEVRHLKVGDFTWIARCRHSGKELVMPYIVERKRIDDLSASITDGRFHEQKFRLKQCGISNLIYIVEKYDKSNRSAIPLSSLMQASVNSLVQDGFIVQHTSNHADSMSYLARMTVMLREIYKTKRLIECKREDLSPLDIQSCSISVMKFDEFNKGSSKSKNFTVREMFIRLLLQLKGVSVDKALAIVEQYPTPRILMNALQESSNVQQILASLQCGQNKRQLGPVISKAICQLYSQKELV